MTIAPFDRSRGNAGPRECHRRVVRFAPPPSPERTGRAPARDAAFPKLNATPHMRHMGWGGAELLVFVIRPGIAI